MRETLSESGRLSCGDTALLLEKRISEEVLSHQERQGLDDHLSHCRKCHNLVSWMSALPEYADELSRAEVRSAYQTVMQNRNHLKRSEHRWKIGAAVAAAAAVAAVVMLDDGMVQSLFSREQDVAEAIECSPAPLEEPVPGVLMTYCDNQQPGTLIENGGDIRVSLRSGAVGMRVDPNRSDKRKVIVVTPQGEVRVKGTVFTVQVADDDTRVEVFRGVVEFVPSAASGEVLNVAAGQGADLRRHTLFDLSRSRTEPLRQALNETVEEREEAAAPEPDKSLSALESGPVTSPRPEESADHPDDATARIATEDATRIVGTFPKAPASSPSIDALIQAAQSCLIDRDWNCASSRYQEILRRYPKSPESTAVLVSLAKIELRRLGRPKKALDHYQIYQRRAPNGPMAEEALFGIAESYRRLGDFDSEEKTLRHFVDRYPGSSQIKRAQARLQKLGL